MARPDTRQRLLSALALDSTASSDFDLNPGTVLPPGRKLRDAAVLIGIQDTERGPRLYLTKRASHLAHHPGQIAFPGGKKDDGDASLEAAALREAREEIGLPPEHVEILGRLPCHETVTSFQVTPVVAMITAPFDLRPEPGEVEEVFTVPLSHVADPNRFQIEGRRWRGQKRYYYTVPRGPYYIWGATARMLRGLAERMAQLP